MPAATALQKIPTLPSVELCLPWPDASPPSPADGGLSAPSVHAGRKAHVGPGGAGSVAGAHPVA